MSKYRRAAKIDKCQPQIVKDLRALGISVELAKDDLLIGYKGITYWFELKDPEHVGKDGKIVSSAIKDSQHELLATWKGHYSIVWSTEQILDEIGFNK